MTSIVQFMDAMMVVSRAIDGVPEFNVATLGETLSIERLASEPLGSVVLTLTNVVVGSRYRVELAAGGLATPSANAEGVAAATTVAITLNYFTNGSSLNNIRIKVRNASGSPTYKPFETLATLSVVPQSIYVGQILDE